VISALGPSFPAFRLLVLVDYTDGQEDLGWPGDSRSWWRKPAVSLAAICSRRDAFCVNDRRHDLYLALSRRLEW